jgi:hypothetical protein
MPEGSYRIQGSVLLDSFDIVGAGTRFVVADDFIWFVQNNGMDGDTWSINNVQTGGAGAIGWRIPYDEDVAGRLHVTAEILSPLQNQENLIDAMEAAMDPFER